MLPNLNSSSALLICLFLVVGDPLLTYEPYIQDIWFSNIYIYTYISLGMEISIRDDPHVHHNLGSLRLGVWWPGFVRKPYPWPTAICMTNGCLWWHHLCDLVDQQKYCKNCSFILCTSPTHLWVVYPNIWNDVLYELNTYHCTYMVHSGKAGWPLRYYASEWHRKSELYPRYLSEHQAQDLLYTCDECLTAYAILSNMAVGLDQLFSPVRPKLHVSQLTFIDLNSDWFWNNHQ